MTAQSVHALLIEDDVDFANLIKKRLAQPNPQSVEIDFTSRLSQGTQLLEESTYDVVLLDLSLPDSQGLDTFLQVYTHAPQTPIVILSGNDSEELAMQAVNAGAQDYLVKGKVDFDQLQRVILYSIERHRILEAWVDAWHEEHHLALHDPLTGLPNRILFGDRFHQAFIKANRNRKCLAIVLIDFDNFKEINDIYGHAIGDQVLSTITKRINGCIREGDTLARLGGDEMVLLLEDFQHQEEVSAICNRIQKSIVQPLQLVDQSLIITASMGISLYPLHGNTLETLLHHADLAMYRAKEGGGNAYQYYLARKDAC